jgi:hypothetical protein
MLGEGEFFCLFEGLSERAGVEYRILFLMVEGNGFAFLVSERVESVIWWIEMRVI